MQNPDQVIQEYMIKTGMGPIVTLYTSAFTEAVAQGQQAPEAHIIAQNILYTFLRANPPKQEEK